MPGRALLLGGTISCGGLDLIDFDVTIATNFCQTVFLGNEKSPSKVNKNYFSYKFFSDKITVLLLDW